MTPERVSIVIAAFNEAGAVGQVVADLRAQIPEAELIVVDDGSSDGTAGIAAAAGALRARDGATPTRAMDRRDLIEPL